MGNQNTKATLAAMLAGTVTKETEMMRVKTTGEADPRVAAQVIKESNLPSATELSFQKVASSNGTTTMVQSGSQSAQAGYGSVPQDAIMALLGGKKPSEIKEELRNKEYVSETVNPNLNSNMAIREEINRRMNGGAPSIKSQSLTETILPSSNQKPQMNFDTNQFVDLVENSVYDILGSIVGEVNNNLKNKELIKQKLTEAVTFLKLTQALKS